MGDIPYLGGRSNFFPDPNVVLVADIMRPFDPSEPADIGLVGIPFDGGVVSHRLGARFGPQAVREDLLEYSTYNIDLDVDVRNLRLADCGDVEVAITDYDQTHRRVEAALGALFETGMKLLIVGGDHSLSGPCVTALCNRGGGTRVGLIDFDTHHDTRSGWGRNAGLWVREIQENPRTPVRGQNIVQIGIHGFSYSEYYRDIVKAMGITVFKPADVRALGIESIMREALERASDGTDAIYVSVDIDVLDTPYVPGTNSPAHGGMMPWDLVQAVVMAGQHPLTQALDVMEISPPLDANRITSSLGAEILMQFLGGLALAERQGR